MNDDLVRADRGFGEHPHRGMEVIIYIVEGGLAQKDPVGSAGQLRSIHFENLAEAKTGDRRPQRS